MKKTKPLSGRGKDIFYIYNNDIIEVKWSNTIFKIKKSIIDDIMNNFFLCKGEWYILSLRR